MIKPSIIFFLFVLTIGSLSGAEYAYAMLEVKLGKTEDFYVFYENDNSKPTFGGQQSVLEKHFGIKDIKEHQVVNSISKSGWKLVSVIYVPRFDHSEKNGYDLRKNVYHFIKEPSNE